MPEGLEHPMPSHEIPVGSAVVTPNQMYSEMLEVGRKVDHLISSFDPWQQEMRNAVQSNASKIEVHAAKHDADMTALDLRVRSLESWRWFLAGLAAIAGPAAAVLAQLIVS